MPNLPTTRTTIRFVKPQIWTGPYLLVRQVMLAITCMKVETSILMGNLVPHGAFKGMIVDKRYSELLEVVGGVVTSKLLNQTTPMPIGFIGSRKLDNCHTSMSADPHPLHS